MAWAAVCYTSPTPRMREPKDELLLRSRRAASKVDEGLLADLETFTKMVGELPRMDFTYASTTLFSARQKLVATAAANAIDVMRFFIFLFLLGRWNSIRVC